MPKHQLSNTQRARMCAIKDEHGMVILSAVVVPDVMVEATGNYDVLLNSDIPVYFLSEGDRIAIAGSKDWDATVKLIGFGLVGIPFSEWNAQSVLASLRGKFPSIRPATAEPEV